VIDGRDLGSRRLGRVLHETQQSRLDVGSREELDPTYDEAELDETGNIELRCWAGAAGALGERKPKRHWQT
jgi:hypothetical protein